MSRPRDRASATGLLPLMEARPWRDGKTITYRYHPIGGKPVALGTDKLTAIRRVLDLNGKASDQGTVGQLWRLYKESDDFLGLSDVTRTQYAEYWGRLAVVFEKGIVSRIKPADIVQYLRVYRKGAKVLANREVSLLSNLFNLAVEMGDVDRNPCKDVRRNKERPRVRDVKKDEFDPFVAWALKQGPSAVVLVSMAEFIALSGNRRAEFLRLAWLDIGPDVARLQRAKQRGDVVWENLTLSPALQAVLERMRGLPGYNPEGYVFRAPKTGNPYTESGFKTMWARLMAKALETGAVKVRFAFHDLRAHYATRFKKEEGVLPELHANPATTAKIYERSREVERKAL